MRGDREDGGSGGYVEPAPSGTESMPAVLALSLLGTCSGLHYSCLGKSLGHQLPFIIRKDNAHTFTFRCTLYCFLILQHFKWVAINVQ